MWPYLAALSDYRVRNRASSAMIALMLPLSHWLGDRSLQVVRHRLRGGRTSSASTTVCFVLSLWNCGARRRGCRDPNLPSCRFEHETMRERLSEDPSNRV